MAAYIADQPNVLDPFMVKKITEPRGIGLGDGREIAIAKGDCAHLDLQPRGPPGVVVNDVSRGLEGRVGRPGLQEKAVVPGKRVAWASSSLRVAFSSDGMTSVSRRSYRRRFVPSMTKRSPVGCPSCSQVPRISTAGSRSEVCSVKWRSSTFV